MIIASLSPSVWIVWIIIGIIGGYMTGQMLPSGAPTWLTLIVGIAAACTGGWLFTHFFGGDDTRIYLSLVISALFTAIAMWITHIIVRHRMSGSDES